MVSPFTFGDEYPQRPTVQVTRNQVWNGWDTNVCVGRSPLGNQDCFSAFLDIRYRIGKLFRDVWLIHNIVKNEKP
ncbi:hypothetical protein CEXT_436691 [Caerostris extrusa]|uniref:Uncharacterized protein n=1 Tax=Caerostris extrusa TaxID=172846 RepID=A0AAV4XW11_CAEEX|nr:hypothetical protein CEXT_436691 [Caerostris extrusa]